MADYLIQSETLDAIADAINTKTGGSSAMTPAQMVTAIGSISGGGGGGAQVVASGTIQGNGAYQIDIPVGTKMPECDFEFCMYAPAGTEFEYYDNDNYAVACVFLNIPKSILKVDLSQNGNHAPQLVAGYTINNDGAITTPDIRIIYGNTIIMKQTLAETTKVTLGNAISYITKSASGFVVHININAWQITFKNTISYNWYVKYYGTDPSTDIVEVA